MIRGMRVVWLLALGLSAAVAADIEVGRTRHFGVGVAAGFPPSVTLKYLADERHGVSLHVGSTLVTNGLHTRVQYEDRARLLRAWDFGELHLTWNIGVVMNLVFGAAAQTGPVRPGISAGVGVEFTLGPFPLTVFGEVSPVFFPLDLLPDSNLLPAGVHVVVGTRLYIGRRSRPEPDVPDVLPPKVEPEQQAEPAPSAHKDGKPDPAVAEEGQAQSEPRSAADEAEEQTEATEPVEEALEPGATP